MLLKWLVSEACLTSRVLGHLKMAPSSLDREIVGYDSSHNWLMSLAMDLAALCDM